MMDPSSSKALLAIYKEYCEIVSRKDPSRSRKDLDRLLKEVGSTGQLRNMTLNDLPNLMAHLDLTLDSQFRCFYNFVFFVCRENGQKSVNLDMAVTAWRLVLNGRFRLLTEWCDFVKKHQRYNISEDTWQQLLVFSRSIAEDLRGYDLQGSWPVLIDEFVEHMYRIKGSNGSSTIYDFVCTETTESTSFPGLVAHLGSKRKTHSIGNGHGVETEIPSKNLMCPTSFLKTKQSNLLGNENAMHFLELITG